MCAQRTGVVYAVACAFATMPVIADQIDPQPARLFTGYLQLMNNYVGRGLSQSVGHPAVQAEIDLNPEPGPYASLSAVTINWIDVAYPGDHVHVEVDATVGYRWAFAQDGALEGGVVRARFPGHYVRQSARYPHPDTTEVFGDIGWRGLRVKLNYAASDAFGTPGSRGEWYLDVSGSKPIGEKWRIGMHLGHKQSHGTNPLDGTNNAKRLSYTDSKLSVTRLLSGSFSLEVAATWNSADPAIYTLDGYDVAGHQIAVTLEKDF